MSKTFAVRPGVAVLTAVLLGVAVGLWWHMGRVQRAIAAREGTETRAERATGALQIAPGPIPTALPLLGPEGRDADGYPTRYVDPAAFRTLLRARKYQELTAYAEQLQAAFEADPKHEYWTVQFAEAFGSAEWELDADLDAWATATPDSFAPYLARAAHRDARMWASRGNKYADETSFSDMRAAELIGQSAIPDVERALTLRPRLVAAAGLGLSIALLEGDKRLRERITGKAIEICTSCFNWRARYLASLVPRWGGSYEAMRAFVAECPVAANPRLRALAGFEAWDRAGLLVQAQRYDEALPLLDDALNHADHWEFLLERARALRGLKRYDEALADLDRANARRPLYPRILSARARIQYDRRDYLDAGSDLLAALRINPTDPVAKSMHSYIVKGLVYEAQQLEKSSQHEKALDAADLAVDLAPLDGPAHAARASIVLGDATSPEKIEALRARVRASPGDFRAVEQLDYALSRQQAWPEILAAWNAYLALHPDDGCAHMERAGTLHQLGKEPEARADAKRACDLGINEGCEHASK